MTAVSALCRVLYVSVFHVLYMMAQICCIRTLTIEQPDIPEIWSAHLLKCQIWRKSENWNGKFRAVLIQWIVINNSPFMVSRRYKSVFVHESLQFRNECRPFIYMLNLFPGCYLTRWCVRCVRHRPHTPIGCCNVWSVNAIWACSLAIVRDMWHIASYVVSSNPIERITAQSATGPRRMHDIFIQKNNMV